jgi:hypothetical protein
VVLFFGLIFAGSGCSLLSDDYQPVVVDQQPNLGSSCATGVECCASVPCAAGQTCTDGSCRTSSSPPGPDAGSCSGADCPLPDQLAPGSSCDDRLKGPDETDSDCGGVCGSTCLAGQGCKADGDCAPSLFCAASSQRCVTASCADDVRNGSERATDCGGGCPGCADGTVCGANADCASGVCDDSARCAPASCSDGVRNGDEADVDCGGACAGCVTGRRCAEPADCQNRVCGAAACAAGVVSCCQAPACNDDVQNGLEVDVDCGGPCGPCPLAAACTQSAECQSGFCQDGRCEDPGTCSDNVRNGGESAIDCGGDRCNRCADQLSCNRAEDCVNNNCFNGVCISCGSQVLDGFETDVDCGGSDPFCRRCNPGERCLINSDCTSNFCNNGFC